MASFEVTTEVRFAAAFLPEARCFLVAAAFFAAALRSVAFFMVWKVYQSVIAGIGYSPV
jgi:predicted membrane protein